MGGTNRTSLDFLSNKLSLSGSTLTVTMQVADLSSATLGADMASIPGTAFQQYVTRWQMGNTIYYAMMETNGAQRSTSTDQFYAGAAQSVDLCSVSACDPHVITYPEAGTAAHNETGTVTCPTTPSASSPCTITITVTGADIGAPTNGSLLEEGGRTRLPPRICRAPPATRRLRLTTFHSRWMGSAASTSRQITSRSWPRLPSHRRSWARVRCWWLQPPRSVGDARGRRG